MGHRISVLGGTAGRRNTGCGGLHFLFLEWFFSFRKRRLRFLPRTDASAGRVPISSALHLTPGEKLRVMRYHDRIEFIPVLPSQQMRGFLRGMDTSIEREDDRL